MRSSMRLAVAGFALLLAAPALAGPDEAESETQAITRLTRSFGKLRGYAMTAEVQGGMAQGAEHRITAQTVNTTYSAVVLGAVCKVDAPQQAFRTRQGEGGAIAGSDGKWKAMLATDEGRLMERLFPRPEAVLAECVRLKKLARWVPPEAGPAPAPAPVPDAPTVDADEDTPAPAGTRSRTDNDDDGLASQVGASHHLRIAGPATVALEHFIRIQNSGCFSEG